MACCAPCGEGRGEPFALSAVRLLKAPLPAGLTELTAAPQAGQCPRRAMPNVGPWPTWTKGLCFSCRQPFLARDLWIKVY